MLKIIILTTRLSVLVVSLLSMTLFLLDTERERVITEIFRLCPPHRVRPHNKGRMQQRALPWAWVRKTRHGRFCFHAARPLAWMSILLLALDSEGEKWEAPQARLWVAPSKPHMFTDLWNACAMNYPNLVWGLWHHWMIQSYIVTTKTWMGSWESFCHWKPTKGVDKLQRF